MLGVRQGDLFCFHSCLCSLLATPDLLPEHSHVLWKFRRKPIPLLPPTSIIALKERAKFSFSQCKPCTFWQLLQTYLLFLDKICLCHVGMSGMRGGDAEEAVVSQSCLWNYNDRSREIKWKNGNVLEEAFWHVINYNLYYITTILSQTSNL